MSIPISQFVPPSLSLPCPRVHYLHLWLYSCPGNRLIDHFSRFHLYAIYVNIQYSFFFFWLSSLHITDFRSIYISLQMTQFSSFLRLSNILWYTCSTSSFICSYLIHLTPHETGTKPHLLVLPWNFLNLLSSSLMCLKVSSASDA